MSHPFVNVMNQVILPPISVGQDTFLARYRISSWFLMSDIWPDNLISGIKNQPDIWYLDSFNIWYLTRYWKWLDIRPNWISGLTLPPIVGISGRSSFWSINFITSQMVGPRVSSNLKYVMQNHFSSTDLKLINIRWIGTSS